MNPIVSTPGTTKTWHREIKSELDSEQYLPVRKRPFHSNDRKAERHELWLAVLVGLTPRAKYRRLRRISGRFSNLPDPLPGSDQAESRRAQTKRALEFVTSLTELQRDGVLSEAELTTQRRSVLDRLMDELREQGLGQGEEITLTSDVVDLINVLQLLGRSRRAGLLPDREFTGHKDQLLALMHDPSSGAAPGQDTEETSH